MSNEEFKLISKGKLLAYLNDTVILEPPCYSDDIYEIFDSYNYTGYSKSGEKPIEKLQNDFPHIENEDLLSLIDYLEMAKDYCQTVCCAFAGIHQSVIVPESDEAKKDFQMVVKACLTRYPWIKPDYVEALLPGICWLCNR